MDYDFQNDWRLLKAKEAVPKGIAKFIDDVFQIMEIRKQVETIRGIKFEVRSREKKHNTPHVHAEYDKYSISICIETGEVLAGNLPVKQQRIAVKWVENHKDFLQEKWSDIAIAATSIMTKSRLDFTEDD